MEGQADGQKDRCMELLWLIQHSALQAMEPRCKNDAPLQATVYRWTAALQHGQQSTEDEHGSGLPTDVRTEGNVNSVQDTILKDRRQTIRHVA